MKHIREEIDGFLKDCESEEYVDTTTAIELLRWIKSELRGPVWKTAMGGLRYAFIGDHDVVVYEKYDNSTMFSYSTDKKWVEHQGMRYYIHWKTQEIRRWDEPVKVV